MEVQLSIYSIQLAKVFEWFLLMIAHSGPDVPNPNMIIIILVALGTSLPMALEINGKN